ncbi:flagellar biosynthesis protein FliQ [Sphingomonas sp. LHG3443-2]|uniref:flagellar biosynthesis protein FliQ n=1 Tax=Sphingomonas sp. LHG3443-2 TaxID=2804639 RepID=UPI003CF561DF
MAPGDVLDLTRAALVLLLTLVGPLLAASLITGVVIGLLQALTQIQEQTLTFVPKLVIMSVTLLLTLPLMGAALSDFTAEIGHRIIGA